MKAEDNKTYAIINSDKVTNIFTKEIMASWNENDIHVVEIPNDKLEKVNIGTEYKDNNFVIVEPKIVKAKEGKAYAIIESNKVISIFTKEMMSEYDANKLQVVEIPSDRIGEVSIGTEYKDKNFVEMPLDSLKSLQIQNINLYYNGVIQSIMQEDTPISEMISWETQEKEAKAYLESKKAEDAPSIQVMAQTQGRELEEFSNKIIEKATKYRQASAFLIGYRQKLIKEVENAKTHADVRKVRFDENLVMTTLGIKE